MTFKNFTKHNFFFKHTLLDFAHIDIDQITNPLDVIQNTATVLNSFHRKKKLLQFIILLLFLQIPEKHEKEKETKNFLSF